MSYRLKERKKKANSGFIRIHVTFPVWLPREIVHSNGFMDSVFPSAKMYLPIIRRLLDISVQEMS